MSGNSEPLSLEKAIDSIKTAANEIPAEDFISYSTILDVHLTHAYEEFSPEDQGALLGALEEVLKEHEALARDIAWDLVSVLLPFLESSHSKTADLAEALIREAAAIGNPREVFIKTLEALSQIPWSTPDEDQADDGDDEAHHSGDEGEAAIQQKTAGQKDLAAQCAARKFTTLISALATVHPRIATKFPSRFLSTELSTLLGAFTKAVEVVDLASSTKAAKSLLAFVQVIHPKLTRKPRQKLKQGERPPLPPRVSTAEVPTRSEVNEEEDDSPEDKLQARLIASFLSHVLELYLIRARKPTAADAGPLDGDNRGLEIGWAGEYDANVVRPKKSKVPGGDTLIDQERASRSNQPDIANVVEQISWMCEVLDIEPSELLDIVEKLPDHEEEDDNEEDSSPTSAHDVPLSKTGSLLLLAHRLSYTFPFPPTIPVFPTLSSVAHSFMIYGPGQSQPAVMDAILFLGAYALRTAGLGDPPEQVEPFMIYLQIFAVISTNASSAQQRFLAHQHVAACLRAHPNEAVRLAYVRDTLEHCPFESLKAAVVGILKDEIIHAITPVETDEHSAPSTPISIFGTPLCLNDLFDVLFLDVDAALGPQEEDAWGRFKDLYTRLAATLNFYLFLLLSDSVRDRLAVAEKGFAEKVEKRFLAPLGRWLGVFEKREDAGMEVGVLKSVLERIAEIREKVGTE